MKVRTLKFRVRWTEPDGSSEHIDYDTIEEARKKIDEIEAKYGDQADTYMDDPSDADFEGADDADDADDESDEDEEDDE